jgi:hypothetical protein
MAATITNPGVQAAAARLGRQMRALGAGMDLVPVVDVEGGPGPSSTNPIGKRSFNADRRICSASRSSPRIDEHSPSIPVDAAHRPELVLQPLSWCSSTPGRW